MAPSILARRNRDRKRVGQIPVLRELYRDQVVYAGAILGETLRSYVGPVHFDALVSVDGAPEVTVSRVTDIVINNTPMYGGEWVPSRKAVADDGLLDLSSSAKGCGSVAEYVGGLSCFEDSVSR